MSARVLAGITLVGLGLQVADFIIGFPSWDRVLPILCIFLTLVLLIFYFLYMRNQKKTANVLEGFSYIHNTIHMYRDELSGQKIEFLHRTSGKELDTHFNKIFQNTLNQMQYEFAKILSEDCVASFKLLSEDKRNLVHKLYSANVTHERINQSKPLPIDAGLVKKIKESKEVKWINDISKCRENFWKFSGKDYDKFYKSCMAAPINVDGEFYGLLSIDCKKPGVFEKNFTEIISFYSDLMSATCQMYNLARTINMPSE